MMRCLYVGDPHVRVNNLKESETLLQFVLDSANANMVDQIVILGDLHHNHANVRLEVLAFWNKWLHKLSDDFVVIALVGNHDQTGDYNLVYHSLEAFKETANANLRIIDKPTQMGVFAYVPYIHGEDAFTEASNSLAKTGAKTLVCHQTFDGSKYDNGMYAPDGFSTEGLNFDLLISGHIHSRQRYGKVIYPGTATWQTVSDANTEKGLWLVEHEKDGSIFAEKYLDTSKVVQPIYEISWSEGSEMPEIPEGRVTIELVGTSTWINQQKPLFKGKIAFKTKITDRAQSRTRKGGKGLEDFIMNIFVPASVKREAILAKMKEMNLVS